MVFFSLFLDGKGDFINSVIKRNVIFGEKVKYFIRFGECINDKWEYRFAFYFRFVYWVYNMLYRRRILG